MEYKKYQHIEKLGTTEVEGILDGEVHLFYKIDGTNACVYLKEDNTLGFGSRNRELSLMNDNQDFVKTIVENEEIYKSLKTYLLKYPERIIYGEFLIPVTLKTYKNDAWKKFYIFDIYDTINFNYIPYEIYSKELDELELLYIPEIVTLNNPTFDDIKGYLASTGNFLINDGLGEGIVIKRYDYINKYGRITWAKMLTEDFSERKHKVRTSNKINKDENYVEYEIIKLMTIEHINKEFVKLKEAKGDWSSKYIFELINRTFNEFFRDNWEIILKKFHNPTINFRVLRSLSDEKIKETLGSQIF